MVQELDAATLSGGSGRPGSPLHRSATTRQDHLPSPDRLEASRLKTAKTLELSRMLEELTVDLQTAHIISPSSERAGAMLNTS
mmetsp:Transcript_48251/g.129174  ORF Transcript_48251/g.129174 Transcript_48251/m.129174 type:complete len:83 (+) Transcript_48251:2-250(+)